MSEEEFNNTQSRQIGAAVERQEEHEEERKVGEQR
jgi:hypothetical protein